MTDENPYSAPAASLDTGVTELYEPTIFSFNGRLGRLRYLAYSIGLMFLLMLVMMPIMGLSGFMAGDGGMSVLAIVAIIAFYAVATVLSVMFGKRRLNDLNRNGWWLLLSLVPFVNLLLGIYMFFFPGSEDSNEYGSPPVANTLGVKILALIFPVIMLIGIAAAIILPMMQ